MLGSANPPSSATMSLNVPSPQTSSPPKRPRLSLQIKTPGTATILGKSITALKADIDPSSPTAFNTLSNAYAVAIENSSPRTARPTPPESRPGKPTFLRLETTNFNNNLNSNLNNNNNNRTNEYKNPSQRTQTPGPFSITYPDTPSSAYPGSLTPITALPEGDLKPASTAFTFTPPQSAGAEQSQPRVFTFAANPPNNPNPSTPRTPRRRMTVASQHFSAPYTHPRSLHSILRNSPLPPRTAATPATPSRMSMRLANRANKKVGYNNPLTETIQTNKYVKSHIDLLAEDSPQSAMEAEFDNTVPSLELAMEYTGDETRDGGQTPGPFEEMRRRMAESDLETPGARKRKRREKKRKWEWTITTAETDGDEDPILRTPLTALRLKTPVTAIRRAASVLSEDSEMSEPEERYAPSVTTDSEMSERDDWEGSVQSEHFSAEGSDDRPQTSHSL